MSRYRSLERSINPNNKSAPIQPGDVVEFSVEASAVNAGPNTDYIVVLLSADGYVYDEAPISYSEQDLQGPDPSERDIRIIPEANEVVTRDFVLEAPMLDVDIASFMAEYDAFVEEKQQEGMKAFLNGDSRFFKENNSWTVTPADKVKIAGKYVRLEVHTGQPP